MSPLYEGHAFQQRLQYYEGRRRLYPICRVRQHTYAGRPVSSEGIARPGYPAACFESMGEETIVVDFQERGWKPHGSNFPNEVEKTVFATFPIAEEQAPVAPQGSVTFRVPGDIRHSSVSPEGDRVVDWGIHIVGERTDGVTFEDDFPVTIQPVV